MNKTTKMDGTLAASNNSNDFPSRTMHESTFGNGQFAQFPHISCVYRLFNLISFGKAIHSFARMWDCLFSERAGAIQPFPKYYTTAATTACAFVCGVLTRTDLKNGRAGERRSSQLCAPFLLCAWLQYAEKSQNTRRQSSN